MHPNKPSLATSFMLAAMARGGLKLPHVNEEPAPRPRRERQASKLMPHQGKRECARRLGGSAWIAYRNADRQRRGLPPRAAFFDFETYRGRMICGSPANLHNIPRVTADTYADLGGFHPFRDTTNDGGFVQ